MDANEAALQMYEEKQEEEQIAYENMLDDLRGANPEDYEGIIYSHGWGDVDLTKVLGDI